MDLAGWWLPVLAFAVSMSATPGPNNVMVAASGATFGFRPTLPHILGISVGFPLMVLLVALGAGAPLRAWPWLHDVLRWVGAAYLLWLAWHIATARPAVATGPAATGPAAPRRRPLSFVQAALFQWVNPKAWVIAAGTVVTYTSGGPGFAIQAAILAAVFLVTTLMCVAMWTGIGAGAARILRSDRALRHFNWAMAGLLVLSLIPMLGE
jgi:threonine/homoserine/homoserine lactone efflux protein